MATSRTAFRQLPLVPRKLTVIVTAWLVFTVMQWLVNKLAMRSFVTTPADVVFRITGVLCWIGITIGLWAWIGLVDRRARPRAVVIGAHACGIVAAGLVDTMWRRTAQALLWGHVGDSAVGTFLYFLDLTTIAYFAIVILKRVSDAQDAVVRQERRQLTLRTQLARAQLDFLELQLQPHFLFNSLGAVIELAHDAPAAASRMLHQLAALLRFAVHGRGQMVTLEEELDALEPYLDIQRVRFADWLTISREVTDEALRVAVPRLTLQPLVENAIRHGLTGRAERGHLTICATVKGRFLHLQVRDNGVGLSPARAPRPSGVGLGNLSSRLHTLYGDDATVTLRTAPDGGAITEVRLLASVEEPDAEQAAHPVTEEMPVPVSRFPDVLRPNAYVYIAAVWLVWGALWIALNVTWLAIADSLTGMPLLALVGDYAVSVLVWTLLTAPMLAAARRLSFTHGFRWWRVGAHVALGLVFALAHVAAWQVIERPGQPLWSSVYVETMLCTIMMYALLVGLASYQQIAGWLRERETATARLRAEIAEAHLTAAELRFEPKHVLSRIEWTADTVLCDTGKAEDELTQLANHLRESLDTARQMSRTFIAVATTDAA